MKVSTKVSIATFVIAAHVLGASAALARGSEWHGPREGGAGHEAGAAHMQARMAQRVDLQLARLELALAIKPEQQVAWKTFAEDTRSRIAARVDAERKVREPEAGREVPKTAIERLQGMEERAERQREDLAATRKAVTAFYAELSDAQKKVFDAEFGTLIHPRGKGGPGKREGRSGAPAPEAAHR